MDHTSRTNGTPRRWSLRRRALLIVAATLLAVAAVPALETSAQALPMTCQDGGPPPCELPDPDPEPEPDPEPPPDELPAPTPPPDAECDAPTGFTRPAGIVPPGYVYSPTGFSGKIEDPQPDDTFAADTAGHAAYVGRLRTRVAHGQEEMLVCVDIGTNQQADALTPFALPGPGGHPATITARVVLIDAGGASQPYDFGAAGIDSSVSHYATSTDVHEGFVQMWVPITAGLHEPGFTVRVEIRGTPSLPGGSTQVMGADEVFVHLGPAPIHAGGAMDQGVGVAVDASVISDGPYHPGIDDLSTLIGPRVAPVIEAAIEAKAPWDVDPDVDWDFGKAFAKYAYSTVRTLGTNVHSVALDLEPIPTSEGDTTARLGARATATISPHLSISPRSWGIGTIKDGTCDVWAQVDVSARLVFALDIADMPTRLEPRILFLDTSASTTDVTATGTVDLWGTDYACSDLESTFADEIAEQVKTGVADVREDAEVAQRVTEAINAALDPTDLANGPLGIDKVVLPGGIGFRPHGWYIPTALPGAAEEIDVATTGIDLAAAVSIDDLGSSRFPFSYVPSWAHPLVTATNDRQRPAGGPFDLGVVVSGGTLNQVSRSLTAGEVREDTVPPCCVAPGVTVHDTSVEVGLLDLTRTVQGLHVDIHPSVPPLYLPKPPAGWDAPGNVDLFVPSLRLSVSHPDHGPVPGIATMAADVSVGLDVSLDGGGHLVPILQHSVAVPRFLRLGLSTNQIAEGDIVLGLATDAIAAGVPEAIAEILQPIVVPDLAPAGGPPVHLRNLSVGTVGGGHLGVYVDAVPDEPTAPVTTTWSGPPNFRPTSFTTSIAPTDMPGTGEYKVEWLVHDGDNVLYRSPPEGEHATSQSLSASSLVLRTNPCTGALSIGVTIDVTVSREWRTRAFTKSDVYTWAGLPPANPPHWCNRPAPDPHPEPDPDPDPPVCMRQPWKCPQE